MIAIHQSQFLPWVPYFYKIYRSDIFVVLDHVQFQKNGVQNRNMIKTSQGAQWLTVPVSFNFGEQINRVKVTPGDAYSKLLKTLELNYKRSVFFEDIYTLLRDIFLRQPKLLNELNTSLLKVLIDRLGLKTNIFFSSDMKLKGKKCDLIIEIIKQFGEKEYLTGTGAMAYMDLNKFSREGIGVYSYNFAYNEYRQLWGKELGFISDLSVVDLLFNDVGTAMDYISKNGAIEKVI